LIAFGFKDSELTALLKDTERGRIYTDSSGESMDKRCDAALRCLLDQTESSRREHAREFRTMLLEKLDNQFLVLKERLNIK